MKFEVMYQTKSFYHMDQFFFSYVMFRYENVPLTMLVI